MGNVPQYGPYSPVTTQPNPRPQPGQGQERLMNSITGMFDKARAFVAPAAQYEQQILGEKQAVAEINAGTFKSRTPYTVRSMAFQKAADRIITSRTMETLTSRTSDAIKKADGNTAVLGAEMAKIQSEIGASLPDLPGLAVDFSQAFHRASSVAGRKTLAISNARIVAQHKKEASSLLSTSQDQVNMLALQGGTPEEIQAQIAQAQKHLAAYGPQGAFTLGGVQYKADPKRAGMFTPEQISGTLGKMSQDATRIMLEASFQQSENPSAVVDKFRADVFSGKSPLPPSDSLKLLAKLEGRAYTVQARRTAEAKTVQSALDKAIAARTKAEKGAFSAADVTVSALTKMAENGALEMLPPEQIAAYRGAVQHNPDLALKLEQEIAVAQAAIDTHGMTYGQLKDYAAGRTAEMAKMAQAGGVDFTGVAVLDYLSPTLKTLRDAVGSESAGVPAIKSGILDGVVSQVNFAALRKQANGNKAVIKEINVTEKLLATVQGLGTLSPKARQTAIDAIDASIARTAALGTGLGQDAVLTLEALPSVVKWSKGLATLAGKNVVDYAARVGISLPEFTGAKTLGDLASVIVDRSNIMTPIVLAEGVKKPGLPLRKEEISVVTTEFMAAPRSEQVAFLGHIAALGKDQAGQVFTALGGDKKAMGAAGHVYLGGNHEAASLILQGGSGDIKMPTPNTAEIASSRATGLGDMLANGWLTPEALARVDYAAMAYAKGAAISGGSDAVSTDNLDAGYQAALGRQQDGTGGVQDVAGYWRTLFGYTQTYQTILPPGWDGARINSALSGPQMDVWARTHSVLADNGVALTGQEFFKNIAGLIPVGNETFIPVDPTGKWFQSADKTPVTIDLKDFSQ